MAKTPFKDVGSTDILSAHISGIQHAVNNVEEILRMRTATLAGHSLQAVVDQDDPMLRYRIYEGTVRGWLEDPAPVIKRDGLVVAADEYTISPAYGVVVFHTQQPPDAVVTADVTHITAGSDLVDELLAMPIPILHRSGTYRAHGITAGPLPGDLATLPDALDAFPFIVPYITTYDAMAIYIDTADPGMMRVGIYRDNSYVYPGELVLDAGEIETETPKIREWPINLTLEPGLYWIVRINSGAPALTGVAGVDALAIGHTDWMNPAVGRRVEMPYPTALPDTFPAGGYLLTGDRPAVFLRRD